MRKVVIFGNNHFAEEVAYFVETDGHDEVVAYTLDDEYVMEDSFAEKELIPFSKLEQKYRKDEIEIIVAIGYNQMNTVRKAVTDKVKNSGWKIGQFIHSTAQIYDASIGEGNIIFDFTQIRHHTKIGDGNIVLANSIISHDCSIGDYNYFAGSVRILGCNKIGNFNFMGNSMIKTDSGTIGDMNLCAAGVVVNSDLESQMLVTAEKCRVTKSNQRLMNIMLMKQM